MKVAVIGAGGFVGQRVTQLLLASSDVSAVHAIDRVEMPRMPNVTTFQGNFSDAEIISRGLDGVSSVIFLAAVLGGAAEDNYPLARQVNIDATLDLIDYLRASAPQTRFVNASTVAAYGDPLPAVVNDATPLAPQMVYGAQKVMIEVLLSNFARREWLDAVSLRPAGVMARDGVNPALKTAFMSRLFYAVARGEDITLPVSEDSTTWMASRDTVASNFVEAALCPEIGARRAFTLPALRVRFAELVAALRRRFPDSGSTVRYDPDPQIVALFGSHPPLVTETADALGFSRDADVDALVSRAFE